MKERGIRNDKSEQKGKKETELSEVNQNRKNGALNNTA